MKSCDTNKESLNLMYWDVNNGQAMSNKLPVNDFEWVKKKERSHLMKT